MTFGFYNREKIFLPEPLFYKRWGSIYEEFKKNKGFLSCQLYSIFLLRRLLFAFSQIFLNKFIYFQQALNIAGSVVQLVYMLFYLPFRDAFIGSSCYIGEICTLFVMITSLFFINCTVEKTIELLESIIIFSVLGTIVIQTLISFVLLWRTMKELCIRLNNNRVSEILKNARKVLPLDSNNKDYEDTGVASPSNFRNIENGLVIA